MKLLFLGILITNLLVFGWFGLGPGKSPSGQVAINTIPLPAGVAGLQLLAEEKAEPAKLPEPKKPGGPTIAFLDPYCFSVGPIAAKSTLRELRDLLTTQGINAEARREEFEEFSGNWIFLPQAENRAEARKMVKLLTEKGIKDHLIVPNGPKRNAVSLGFFRNEPAARNYLKRLKELGFSPVMEENYRSGLRYWLDFSSGETSPLSDKMIRNLDNQFEVGISRNSCETSS